MNAQEFVNYVRQWHIETKPLETFVQLVSQMRERQRAYFQHRLRDDLIASKELERQIDQWVAAWGRALRRTDNDDCR